jgi:hypothetical protein
LGVSAGASMQMFFVSFLLMLVSTSDNAGPIRELSHEYYPVFRGVFLLTFFFCLYGTCVFIWQRNKIDYCSTLGVSYAHTYQYIERYVCMYVHVCTVCIVTIASTTCSNCVLIIKLSVCYSQLNYLQAAVLSLTSYFHASCSTFSL